MSATAEGVRLSEDASDEELVDRYHHGDRVAVELLLERYRKFARLKARYYFIAGADRDDIIQEGMIGLYKAIRDYRRDRDSSFHTFAEVCITRQFITAVKSATRNKHFPLNTYVSLSTPVPDGESGNVLADVIPASRLSDPAELVMSNEALESIQMAFAQVLSDFEAHVLQLYVEGKSYQEISATLGRHVKAIDNALQRIKRKMEAHMNGEDEADRPAFSSPPGLER